MSNYLQLKNISYVLPTGKPLWTALQATFSDSLTAIVGRNGVGKSILAKIMAGLLLPTTGQCIAPSVYYMAQDSHGKADETVADALGISPVLAALSRIESGDYEENDFDVVGDKWTIEQDSLQALRDWHLDDVNLQSMLHDLSGGMIMRIRLASAFLSCADVLILDEPSNHLDMAHKQLLLNAMQQYAGQIILISHDRFLLTKMTTIVELSEQGLERFGGNYAFYETQKNLALAAAQTHLAQVKLTQKKNLQAMQDKVEQNNKRQAQANKGRKDTNQAKILLDRQKNRSELSTGKLNKAQQQLKETAKDKIQVASDAVAMTQAIVLHQKANHQHQSQQVAALDNVYLPYVPEQARQVNWHIMAGERLAIIANNGMGKSTLLQVLAGQLQSVSGTVTCHVPMAYIDQNLAQLEPDNSLLAQIMNVASQEQEPILRMQLAQMGLDEQKIQQPIALLSGGEKLKAALALVLYGQEPVQLLLLDEPNNHLDLPSLTALETLLTSYMGSLVVVSHDWAFLQALHLTGYLLLTEQGWQKHDLLQDTDLMTVCAELGGNAF